MRCRRCQLHIPFKELPRILNIYELNSHQRHFSLKMHKFQSSYMQMDDVMRIAFICVFDTDVSLCFLKSIKKIPQQGNSLSLSYLRAITPIR